MFVELRPVVVGGLPHRSGRPSTAGVRREWPECRACVRGRSSRCRSATGAQLQVPVAATSGCEGDIEEQNPILGVVDDVGDLLGEQSRVDGVHDGTGPGYTKIERQVAVAVPRERRNPVALLDTQLGTSALATCFRLLVGRRARWCGGSKPSGSRDTISASP